MSPARWLVVTVTVADAELRPLAAEAMMERGSAVQEDGDALVTYLPETDEPDAAAESLRAAVADALSDGVDAAVSWTWRADEDWAATWKAGLGPREVTPRLVVKPTWTEWEAKPGQIVLDVDPQMAFGTGEHATTRGCLRLLDAVVREGDRVFDVGSGSAILAIAAVRLGAASAVAIEYDPDANINAVENLERNGVAGRVEIVEAMADGPLLAGLGPADLLLANILSGVIRPLLPAFRDAIAASADPRLIVSGILRTEAPDVVCDAEAAGFRVDRVDEEEEWWSALLRPVG